MLLMSTSSSTHINGDDHGVACVPQILAERSVFVCGHIFNDHGILATHG